MKGGEELGPDRRVLWFSVANRSDIYGVGRYLWSSRFIYVIARYLALLHGMLDDLMKN